MRIQQLWFEKRKTGEQEIHLELYVSDREINRHCAVVVSHPATKESVAQALFDLGDCVFRIPLEEKTK